MSTQQKWQSALADVFFPPVCVNCGTLVEGGGYRHLCATCVPKLNVVEPPFCTTCGHPFYGEMSVNRLCAHCAQLQPAYQEGRTVVLLKGSGRSLVHALKYHRGLYVLKDIEEIIRASTGWSDYLKDAWLVPVPLHARKLRERGYNQSRFLAEVFARVGGPGARVIDLLRRTTDTPSQTSFDRRARQQNLKNAFALARGVALNPGQKIILVDDVFTTGSTLNACATVLRRSGYLNLFVATFGHG